MPTPFSGGCACGAIRYECSAEPLYMGNCHCRDCQRATGSAYFTAVGVSAATFRLTTGTPGYYEKQADSGSVMRRAFCQQCGSPVFLTNAARPNLVVLYAGSLDDPSWVRPAREIYTASAQPWDYLNPELPKFAKMPVRSGAENRRPRVPTAGEHTDAAREWPRGGEGGSEAVGEA